VTALAQGTVRTLAVPARSKTQIAISNSGLMISPTESGTCISCSGPYDSFDGFLISWRGQADF